MYNSFRSRWVLPKRHCQREPTVGGAERLRPTSSYLCACLFNSCLLVRAGLLSGFGPRRFAGCPSLVNFLSEEVRDLRKPKPRAPFFSLGC